MDDKLKPCPFCGGVAQRVEIPADEHDPNAGGSYIACQFCLASSSIAFGDKSSLVDNWNSRAGDARIRAEARAEALREVAERAALDENWLARWFSSKKREHNVMMGLDPLPSFGSPIPPSHYFANFMGREIKKLIDEHFSAILADEPKEERQGCFRCRNRPQPGGGRQLCDSCRLIVGQNYDPAPLADEPKEERGAEGPCCRCVEEKGAPPCEFCGPPAWEAFQERESSWEPMVRALIGLLPRRERRWLKGVVDAEVERRIKEGR